MRVVDGRETIAEDGVSGGSSSSIRSSISSSSSSSSISGTPSGGGSRVGFLVVLAEVPFAEEADHGSNSHVRFPQQPPH